ISFDSGIQDRTHSLPRDGPEVLGSLHAATRERHHAVGTVAAFAKQPTDNNHVLRMHVPHYLSFSDRVEVVNLDTHVTCRVRPLNGMDALGGNNFKTIRRNILFSRFGPKA